MPHYVSYASRIFHRGTFSIFLALALIFFNSISLQAQNLPIFDKDGMFHGKKGHLRYNSTDVVSQEPGSALSEKEKKLIREKIAERIQRALFNCKDKEIWKQYVDIWGEPFARKYEGELLALQRFLLNNSIDNTRFDWVPSPAEINNIINSSPLIAQKAKSYDQSMIPWWCVKKDLYQDFLVTRWESTLKEDSIKKLFIDQSYLDDWRKLEKWYNQTIAEAREIKQMDSSLQYDRERLGVLNSNQSARARESVALVKTIKSSTFLRKWLWYTDGIITMNPPGAAKPALAYPTDEPNSFMTARLAKVQDSLNRSQHLKEFAKTGTIFNNAELTINYPKPDDNSRWLVEYDATQKFKQTNDASIDQVEKETFQISVYNIAKEQEVAIGQSDEELKDQSRAITALNELATQIGAVTQFTKPNIAAFNLLSEQINPMSLPDVQRKIIEVKDTKALIRPGGDGFKRDEILILFEDLVVPLTETNLNEDKRRLLGGHLGTTLPIQRNTFERILPKFLILDEFNFIDYRSTTTIKRSADLLFTRFNTFKDSIFELQALAKNVSDSVMSTKKALESYVAIYGRSLPAKDLEGYTDEDSPAAYYTKRYAPTFPEAPRKLNIAIVFKSNDKAAPLQVVKQTTKLTKRHWLDFSIGLAYTTQDYDVVTPNGKSLPTVDKGDRFNFIAGLHIYPWGLNKIEDKWFAWKNRWSIYAGLSITHALDNYYGGISYDPTPGIRLIGGAHLYKNYRFKIVNDQIEERATGLEYGGVFLSLSMEPYTVGKAIGLFK